MMIVGLLITIMTLLNAEAKSRVYIISPNLNTEYVYCKNAPFQSVCMDHPEHRRLMEQHIENEFLRKRLNIDNEMKFDKYDIWKTGIMFFIIGGLVGAVSK